MFRNSGQVLNYTGVVRYVSVVSKTSQATNDYTIRWIPEAVENLLHNHDIQTRTELAKVLNVSRSTIYNAFDEVWAGEASMKVLAEMAGRFRVPLSRLVTEPGRGTATRQQTGRSGVRRIGQV